MTDAAQRLRNACQALDPDQRFVAMAALGLLFTMFLPWYEKSVVVRGSTSFAHETINAFGAVSFVEAAIFLVAAGVLVLVLSRADRKDFHLPGGDGTVILAAGLWAAALIFYRVFDRPNVSGDAGTVGIQWGFFVAFVAAGSLAYAGQRIRAAQRPQPSSRSRGGDSESGSRPRGRDPEPRPRPDGGDPEPSPRTRGSDPEPSPRPRGSDAKPSTRPAAADEDETEVVSLSKLPTQASRRSRRRDRGVTRGTPGS